MIVVGDVHGCFKTLMDLVKKLPDKQLIAVGDLIDRGPQSKDIIDFFIKNGHYSVMGNHEDMATNSYGSGLWLQNGGRNTLKSYKNSDGIIDKSFDKHKEWMEELPLIIEYKDFIISHSACFHVWDRDHESSSFIESALWERDFWFYENKLPENKVNIFGHTPVNEVTKTDFYVNIDTGCFLKNLGYGVLTAYDMDTDIFYQQENVE